MSYGINELKPKNPILIIDKREIELSLITLEKEVTFIEVYGSLPNIFKVINEIPEEILDITWELIIDKTQFKSRREVFKKYALTSKDSIVDWSRKMMLCIYQSVNKSQPLIKNQKRYKELQEIKGTQTDKTPCYGVYYDTIAKRYPYTLDEFYNLTLRQLHMFLSTIGDESYKELEVRAALANRELKPRMEFNDVTEEEEQQQTDDALEVLKRLEKNYQEKKDGKR